MKRNKVITGGIAAAAAAALALTGASSASAHVSAQMYGSTATSGGYGFTFLRVPHGCGADATNKVSVQIPAGVTAVKPQAKAGWTVTKSKDSNGNITEVTWSGGVLPTDEFDDFGLSVKWPTLAEGVDMAKVYFPTIQTCNADIMVSVGGKKNFVMSAPGITMTAGERVGIWANDKRIGSATVRADGTLKKAFPAKTVNAGDVVEIRQGDTVIASNQEGQEAWTQIPDEGHGGHGGGHGMLDRPAPVVTVMAGTGGH